jgi:hypothetical protein
MGSQVSSKRFNSAKLVHYIIIHYVEQQEISKDVSRKVSHFCSWVFGRVQMKCDGTRWRTGGEVKEKQENEVGNQ